MKNHVPSFGQPVATQSGNAFLYILVAIALFAGLTYVLSRSQDGSEKTALDQAQLQTHAQRLMSYVNQSAQAWLQMRHSITDMDELDLVLPDDGTFNDAPTLHKLFHPNGGGILFRAMDEAPFRANTSTPLGWYFVLVNADWSATSGTDLIMTYVNIDQSLCKKINYLVRQDATIPTVTVDYTATFVNGSSPLTEVNCAECKTNTSLCVENAGVYAFYNVLELR